MPEEEFTVPVKRILENPDEPPKVVHRIFWTRVGSEIMLDVGYFDFVEVTAAKAMQKNGEAAEPIGLHVTDRLIISPEVALHFAETATTLVEDLRNNKLLPIDVTEETGNDN